MSEAEDRAYSRGIVAAFLAARCIAVSLLIYLFNDLISFGTSPGFLSLAAVVGVGFGTLAAFMRLRCGVLFLLLMAAFLLLQLGIGLASSSFSLSPFGDSLFLSLYFDVQLAVAFLAAMTVLTWLHWRSKVFVVAEISLLTALVIWLLSDHRNYNFSLLPKEVLSLAWSSGAGNLSVVILSGVFLIAFSALYLLISTHPALPILTQHGLSRRVVRGRMSRSSFLVIGLILVLVPWSVYQLMMAHHSERMEQLGMGGVGLSEEKQESIGKSPLGFHPSLGNNNQPAALVRLEGDYADNPHAPMLYLREAALSEIAGHELVAASLDYDKDVVGLSPKTGFERADVRAQVFRVPVEQSVFLLANHDVSFSIDFPVSIKPLQNPAPQRFQAAYRAISLAPTYDLNQLQYYPVGDPDWDDQTLLHYLKQHRDHRYADIAQTIAKGFDNPGMKAQAILNFLSEKSIYTLHPNHEIEPGEDPVAPYLFGDMRGYCVHFAHATVYMLRALGIPSRIGTGYLTDLSQSKDGHVLLRMSDRHAWAEGYFHGLGWVALDTQPEQVESHADTEVDLNLLEELMGLVGLEQELFESELLEDEKPLFDEKDAKLPDLRFLLVLLGILLAVLYLVKLLLRFGHFLPTPAHWKAYLRYLSLASYLYDLSVKRKYGETRLEFVERVANDQGELKGLVTILNRQKYGLESDKRLEVDRDREAEGVLHGGFTSWKVGKGRSKAERARAFLSPESAWAFISGWRG